VTTKTIKVTPEQRAQALRDAARKSKVKVLATPTKRRSGAKTP
jgi:hypothetical protein